MTAWGVYRKMGARKRFTTQYQVIDYYIFPKLYREVIVMTPFTIPPPETASPSASRGPRVALDMLPPVDRGLT